MKVKLITTIETIIDCHNTGASFEEAEKEIFERYCNALDDWGPAEDVQAAHSEAVHEDLIAGSAVSHTFVMVE